MPFVIKLSKTQKSILEKKGIVITPFDAEGGELIKDEDLNLTLTTLKIKKYEHTKTLFEGIEELVIKEGISEPQKIKGSKITAELQDYDNNFNGGVRGSYSEAFIKETKKLLPLIRKSIIITVPHGSIVKADLKDCFHIAIWTSKKANRAGKDGRRIDLPERIFGIEPACRDKAYPFSGVGINILNNGYSVAEFTPNYLYIHHDLCHAGNDSEIFLYKKIIEKVIIILNKSTKSKGPKDIKSSFKEMVMLFKEFSMSELKDNIKDNRADLETTIKQLNFLQQKEFNLTLEKCLIEESYGILEEKFLKEVEALEKNPKIKSINSENNNIIISTKEILVKDRSIGELDVYIGLNGEVKIENKTRKVKGYNAPNVNGSGFFPVGKLTNIFPQLISRLDIEAVFRLALNAIETSGDPAINGDLAKNISSWPKMGGIK